MRCALCTGGPHVCLPAAAGSVLQVKAALPRSTHKSLYSTACPSVQRSTACKIQQTLTGSECGCFLQTLPHMASSEL